MITTRNVTLCIATITAIAAFLCSWSSPLLAVDIQGDIRQTKSGLLFKLTWQDSEISFTSETKDQEILLRFNQPVTISNQAQLLKQGSPRIQDLVISFDTIFVKWQSRFAVQLQRIDSGGVILRFTGKDAQAETRSRSKIRLGTIKARLRFDRGYTEEAIAIVDDLLDQFPGELNVLLVKADFLFRLGRYRETMDIIRTAEQNHPGSVAVREAKKRYQWSKRPFLVLEAAHKDICLDLGERFYRIQYETRPFQRVALGIKYSTYGIVYNRNDQATPLIDETHQTELYTTFERDSGSQVKFSLFLHVERDSGVALEQTNYESDSTITYGIDLQRPNWEYFVSQVETDHKHRLRVQYWKQINPRSSYMLFPALNQYILWDLDPTPTSFSFQGAIIHRFHDSRFDRNWMGENSYWSAELDVDFETPLSVEEKDGVAKSRFTKWVHSPRLNAGKQYGCWDFYGYAGYAFRVYNGSGYFWGTHIHCVHQKRLDGYFKLDQYVDENSCIVTLLTLGLKWII